MVYNIIATKDVPMDEVSNHLNTFLGGGDLKVIAGVGAVIGKLHLNREIDDTSEKKIQGIFNDLFKEKIPDFNGEIILKKEI